MAGKNVWGISNMIVLKREKKHANYRYSFYLLRFIHSLSSYTLVKYLDLAIIC